MKSDSTPKRSKKVSTQSSKAAHNLFPIVAIGASAGGIEAVTEFFKNLPAVTGMAFIYVQHLSVNHKSKLTDILSHTTKMHVQEIDDMDKIMPDNVFVIPSNKAIVITDGRIKLIPRSRSTTAVTVDILFSSLAVAQKERVIGIVLSGTGSDGSLGIKAIKQEGGLTFAQDSSAEFDGMPQSAIASGDIDFILSPKKIAAELARIGKHPFINNFKTRKEDLIDNDDPDLMKILQLLHKAVNVDFSVYKMRTIKRRIMRRMLIYKLVTLKEYARLLADKPNEVDLLYQDLLINVTSFFRESDTHRYLKTTLLPKLLKSKKADESLRIWVAACASGSEAYSLAMMLLEIQESKLTPVPIQIFATDLSVHAIAKARLGIYSLHELEGVSAQRLQRFFTKAGNGTYRINKNVREMCVFANHNVLIDPPFSRIDFITCCNLFIYLDTAAQKKVIQTFHYALNDIGYLMLGKSETIGTSQLFGEHNKNHKIFIRKKGAGSRRLPALSLHSFVTVVPGESKQVSSKKKTPVTGRNIDTTIDAILISEFMPASVVINYDMEIQQFRGSTDLYFSHASGKASFNILKMARPDIAFELRNAISESIKTSRRVSRAGIEMRLNGKLNIIRIEVVPLDLEWDEPLILILFNEQEQIEVVEESNIQGKNNSAVKDRRIKKLEAELAAARADALALAREQDDINEALQSANEEVMSSNEELQTTNEELATSKEEIESTNEELITTNQELQTRYEQLHESHEFSEALIATMHDSIVILDKSMRIKSANKLFYEKFHLKENETEGRYLFDIGNKQWDIPVLHELLQLILIKNLTFDNYEITHTFPDIGTKTLLLNASRIVQKKHQEQMILLAIADITELTHKINELQALNEQKKAEKNLLAMADSVPALVWMCNASKSYYFFNKSWLSFTGRTMEQETEDGWIEGIHPDDVQRYLEIFSAAFDKKEAFYVEYRLRRHDGEYRWIADKGSPRFNAEHIFDGYTGGCMDIQEQKAFAFELEREVSKRTLELKSFTYISSHDLQEPLRKIQTFAGRILEKDHVQLSDTGKELFNKMSNTARRMQNLLKDLLDYSRTSDEVGMFEHIDLNKIVEDVKEELKEEAEAKHAVITSDMCLANVIPFQMHQLFYNFISNSLKFAHADRTPHIEVKSKTVKGIHINHENILPEQQYYYISISDNGIGFDSKYSDKIFKVFQRLNCPEKYGGTGIGLAIVKKIVDNHNGFITAHGEPDKGARFEIFIPAT